ncbi:hypothetical protein JTE90_016982 [Oedothorax gibbosus]|uniref:Uncharacterized protein n=1 Tax=Oedothorax gibbosus TaxID=931172 RepID=A0AAV6TMS4_9ARAC|nr:hypothetical protein JTE90_016982 [Oedothorax gibbosus]
MSMFLRGNLERPNGNPEKYIDQAREAKLPAHPGRNLLDNAKKKPGLYRPRKKNKSDMQWKNSLYRPGKCSRVWPGKSRRDWPKKRFDRGRITTRNWQSNNRPFKASSGRLIKPSRDRSQHKNRTPQHLPDTPAPTGSARLPTTDSTRRSNTGHQEAQRNKPKKSRRGWPGSNRIEKRSGRGRKAARDWQSNDKTFEPSSGRPIRPKRDRPNARQQKAAALSTATTGKGSALPAPSPVSTQLLDYYYQSMQM